MDTESGRPRVPRTVEWGIFLAVLTAVISGVAVYVNAFAPVKVTDNVKSHANSADERWAAIKRAGGIGIATLALPPPPGAAPQGQGGGGGQQPVITLSDRDVQNLSGQIVSLSFTARGAEKILAGGRDDFERAFKDLHERHVERTAAEVDDENFLLGVPIVEPIGKSGGSRLVYNPPHTQPGQLARLLRGLTLVVVEVRRDGDDGFGNVGSEKMSGVFAQRL